MTFDGLSEYFCIPTSMSLIKDVSHRFAGPDGIIITIKNSHSSPFYFNCTKFSAFPGELEVLFIGGFGRLEIFGLYSLENGINYDVWVQSIKIFELGVTGQTSPDQIREEHSLKISLLISSYLNNKNDHKSPPKYITNLFKNICKKRNLTQIDPD
eukprot:77194_1